MSVSAAAVIKKVAVAIVSDKKARNKIGIFILSVLVGLLMPIAALLAVFSGHLEFTDEMISEVIDNLDENEVEKLQQVQDTLDAIEEAMRDAGMHSRYEEAQALYMFGLYEYQDEDDFIDRLVGCFEEDQTDYELIDEVNDEFDCDLDPVEYLRIITGIRSTTINTFGFMDPETKNNLDLVFWAYEAYNDGWGYVWGTYGLILTQDSFENLCEVYPDNVENHHDFIQENWVGRRTADCAGLIKGYLWFNPESHQIEYGSNGFTDRDADTLYNDSTVNGTIDTIPETPGLGVWHEGHVGIYIGDGWVIQASGTETGVVKTKLEGSSFTNWFEIPGITYGSDEEEEVTEEEETAESTSETTVETTAETTAQPSTGTLEETTVESEESAEE